MKYFIEKASQHDYADILDIMQYWNMHHIPSVEMEELDLSCFFVARISNIIGGAGGYKVLSQKTGKTTLLGIRPEFLGMGIGKSLQEAMLVAMFNAGVKHVITNTDRTETILWYKKHYGYYEIGQLKKQCDFSLSDVDSWTTLEMNLEEFIQKKLQR
uniref:N-acetyltransferase domain-containing protein n=1 Tax=Chlorobium chlorochromatii (strain CaD3) TaxID=340177 RepID=Q3AS14_CHLCH